MVKPRQELAQRVFEQLVKLQEAEEGSLPSEIEYDLDTSNMTPGEWVDSLIVCAMIIPEEAQQILSPALKKDFVRSICKSIPDWNKEGYEPPNLVDLE